MSKSARYLIELALVVFIILLYLSIVLPNGKGSRTARIAASRADIAAFNTSLEMFKNDCGRFPATEEGL
jgi:type II secretory pathway pseudopilin PulG